MTQKKNSRGSHSSSKKPGRRPVLVKDVIQSIETNDSVNPSGSTDPKHETFKSAYDFAAPGLGARLLKHVPPSARRWIDRLPLDRWLSSAQQVLSQWHPTQQWLKVQADKLQARVPEPVRNHISDIKAAAMARAIFVIERAARFKKRGGI